jgi:hypothetical protein
MTDEELDRALSVVPFLDAWLTAVKAEARQRLEDGSTLEHAGLKPGNRRRNWAEEETAQAWLREQFPLDVVAPRKMVSVAQAEKLVGQGKLPADLVSESRDADKLVFKSSMVLPLDFNEPEMN